MEDKESEAFLIAYRIGDNQLKSLPTNLKLNENTFDLILWASSNPTKEKITRAG